MDNVRNCVHTRSHSNTYLSFCVAALMVMSLILIVSNINKQKFEDRTNDVAQSEATLLYLMRKWDRAPTGSEKKLKAEKEFDVEIAHTKHGDYSLYYILNLLFGEETSSKSEEEIDGFTQSEATLLYLIRKWKRSQDGSEKKLEARKELEAEIAHRKRYDRNVILMWKHSFGKETSLNMFPIRQPTVDEFNCMKMLTKTYEHHCGVLSAYGLKYITIFANICSAGFSRQQMIEAISCPLKN